jgi:cell wall-associated NlpC family hydrolase
MIPDWHEQYVGIPYKHWGRDPAEGLDCWGLCILVMREQFGIDLPSFDQHRIDTFEREATARLIEGTRPFWKKVDEPALGDLILLRIWRMPTHVGVWLARDRMLNVRKGISSCVERLDTREWRNRVLGFYRPMG